MSGAASLHIEDAELPRLKRRILAQHLDDRFGIGPLLQFLEDEHLVRVRVVAASLTRGDALPGHDDRLHAFQKFIVSIDAGRRRDDDAASTAIDGDHRPGGQRARWHRKKKQQKEQRDLTHAGLRPRSILPSFGASYAYTACRNG